MDKKIISISLANPRGFCAGVDRAIEIVEQSLDKYGAPIYVRNEVVHNKFVIESLKKKGAIFVNDLKLVPENSYLIYSAHGVSKKVKSDSDNYKLKSIDATCPLVTKVHKEVNYYLKNNYEIIMIGHKGHPEVEGTLGQDPTSNKMHLIDQPNRRFKSSNFVPTYEDSVFLSRVTMLSNPKIVTNSPDESAGFCHFHKNNPLQIETKCRSLSKDICASTNCCVLLGGASCVAGDKNGPFMKSNYNSPSIKNTDHYYSDGKCYGNCQ